MIREPSPLVAGSSKDVAVTLMNQPSSSLKYGTHIYRIQILRFGQFMVEDMRP